MMTIHIDISTHKLYTFSVRCKGLSPVRADSTRDCQVHGRFKCDSNCVDNRRCGSEQKEKGVIVVFPGKLSRRNLFSRVTSAQPWV